jgi:hypothetical protein
LLISLYVKPYGDNTEVLLGRFWENLRISWEHIGNMMGTRKEMPKIYSPPHPTPLLLKKGKTGPLMNPS